MILGHTNMAHNLVHDTDIMSHDTIPTSSRNGWHHCKAGQETIHDIVNKTTELFNLMKTTNANILRPAENESKRAKMKDILSSIMFKFDVLRTQYNRVNEISSSLSYIQVKSLIPYKDDPDNIEQIMKHRDNLSCSVTPEQIEEKQRLVKRLAELDEKITHITYELRDFLYEINTMLHVSK